MYWRAPSAKAMQAWGVALEDIRPAAVDLWPDNVLIKDVFSAMGTQWRTAGMGKPIGLDYGVLPFVMRRMTVPHGQWDDVFDGVRVMEAAALEEMHKE